jgi:DNA helicase-2/ATP-dependent DNA helicase PcrA
VSLTLNQRKVVETVAGHLVVLAGPGSGKTHTITEKVIHLFKNHVIAEPYGLLAITFTNAAANEMRSRLRSKGFRQWDRVWVDTFHGFGHYLLTCYGGDVGVREDFNIIEKDDQTNILNQIISGKLRGVRPYVLKQQIDSFKRHGIYPGQGDSRLASSLRIAYAEYQRLLNEGNTLDFGDLVALAVRLLKESDLAKRLFTNFFHYVVVDEFQDTDRQQLAMIHIMAKEARGSTIVADDDQAIYRFRGADRANVVAIEKLLGATRITLDTNFRSDQVIVDAAKSVIEYEANRTPKEIVTVSRRRGHLYKHEFPNPEEEAIQVVKWIVELNDKAKVEDWGEIAVITRHRWRADSILEKMDTAQMPWFDRARLGFQDSWETTLGLAVLALSCNLDSSDELYRVMVAVEDGGLAFYLGDEDALDVVLQIRDRLATDPNLRPTPANAQEVLNIAQVQEMMQTYSRSTTDYDRLLKNLQTMVADVAREAQFLNLSLVEIVNRLAGHGAVQVISSHGSKGREFDYVFIIGLEDDVLPDYRAHKKIEDIDEERRIFYVSLTRARKAAYLTSASERLMPWGEVQKKIPSRFINHIAEEFFSVVSVKQMSA